MEPSDGRIAAILPCKDLDATERFYARLGFRRADGPGGDYRILSNGRDALHLRPDAEGWLAAGRNPFGPYLRLDDVDGAAARFAGELVGGAPAHKAWGMYEFALSDPDGTLVRVGRPSRAA
jgi:catechol 2,3-dioxygenase-like lactoylglutathione lyase family enzyme